jgi:hypothetical protein
VADRQSAGDYRPLLQGNVFQPRVVVIHDRAAHGSASGRRAPRPGDLGGKPARPALTDGWNDWKYTGIAQLDQQTYALMDQPEKKQSRFVKVGDTLDDAIVTQVADDEVTLRQADGSLIRVKRVDPVADALRAARAAAPAAPGAAPNTTPTAPAPGAGPATNFNSPQAPFPLPPVGGGAFGGRGG